MHTGNVAGDRGVHALIGIRRFPTDDTMRNLFNRFTRANRVQVLLGDVGLADEVRARRGETDTG